MLFAAVPDIPRLRKVSGRGGKNLGKEITRIPVAENYRFFTQEKSFFFMRQCLLLHHQPPTGAGRYLAMTRVV
jgi:hypothetical protein